MVRGEGRGWKGCWTHFITVYNFFNTSVETFRRSKRRKERKIKNRNWTENRFSNHEFVFGTGATRKENFECLKGVDSRRKYSTWLGC